MRKNIKRILISRTDKLGDVVLTFPMIGYFKKFYPDTQVFFLGRSYTKPLIDLNINIRGFLNYDDIEKLPKEEQVTQIKSYGFDAVIHVYPVKQIARLCKDANIPTRIGTSHRLYHWFTCNKLVRFSRKKSNLHEAQLNIKLLKPFKIKAIPKVKELPQYYGLKQPYLPPEKKMIDYYNEKINIDDLLDNNRINLLIHPKSGGSAVEWGTKNFGALLDLLDENKYKLFLTGTKAEGEILKDFVSLYSDKLIDVAGVFTLEQFIYFISRTDGIVAASTGPLHIAAAFGKFALGLFAPNRPIHPQRWAPIGKNAFYVADNNCNKGPDFCIKNITAEKVHEKIKSFFEKS